MVQTDVEDSHSELDAQAFNSIPPRPPTPPRESPRSAAAARNSTPVLLSNGPIPLSLLSSPREISPPTSSAESASGRSKSVTFSPWTTYHKPEQDLTTPTQKKVRPSSSTDPKSLKSILKPFSPLSNTPGFGFVPGQPFVAHTHASFISMLESVVQALDSSERSKKLDTYITFSNTLKAYDDIPDIAALEAKIPILIGFIKRDLHVKLDEGGNPDSQLIQQAIKLLNILCWTPRLVSAVDDQSATYFVQHAIQKVEDTQTSKYSINLWLHFIAQNKLPVKLMTPERCNRIITSLESMDQRVQGKSISKERIDVYYKLLQIRGQVMAERVSDWMEHAFGGLLSGVREVRNRALVFMSEVAKTLGGDKPIARAVTAIFSREGESGGKMFEQIRSRLDHFVNQDQEGIYVARMWAIVLLLVRGRDHWEFFNPWLRVIQSCFNVSDKDVKVEAQVAWSKLIYSMNIGPSTTKKLLHLLCKPLEQYLNPSLSGNTRKPRKAAMVNVAVLLYYGFRPNSSPKQLSEIWEVVVVGLVEKLALASTGKDDVLDGCSILCSLFDGTTSKVWSEPRVLAGQTIKAEEIPRLDPKWVRNNCSIVLKTVEVGLWKTPWTDESIPGARLLWKLFTRTLADAGSKEIKISAELMDAVSQIFNMFQRIWSTGPEILKGSPHMDTLSFMELFTYLVETSLDSLGPFCFTEKQLAYDEQSKFSPAATPTHKYSSNSSNGLRYPPILHIFRLLMSPPTAVEINNEYFSCVRRILTKCLTSQDSRRKKLHLIASCEGLLTRRTSNQVELGLWDILAELTVAALPTPTREKALMSPSPIGGEFRDAVSILMWGSHQDVSQWERLFEELTKVIATEMGETYVSLNVVEPLAESLRYWKQQSNLLKILERTIALFDKASYPKMRATVENNLKVHFGLADRRPSNMESFENLFALGNELLKTTYDTGTEKSVLIAGLTLLSAVSEFIERSPSGSIAPLQHLQDGVGEWTQDKWHIISSSVRLPAQKRSPSAKHLQKTLNAATATKLWCMILGTVEKLPRHDTVTLSNISSLLTSGFESRRKGIVNATIKTWNSTFGKQIRLSYPKRLRSALRKLRTVADISLPNFPEEDDDDSIPSPPIFDETQEQESQSEHIFSSPTPARRYPSAESRPLTSSPATRHAITVKGTLHTIIPRRSLTPTYKRTSPLKPKHMDSQLDFVPIGITDDVEPVDDSQIITEHQKEVREKQAYSANLFPELAMTTPTKKATRTLKSPGLKRFGFTSEPQTPSESEKLLKEVVVPETALKLAPSTPQIAVSFVAESSMGSPSLPPPTSSTSREIQSSSAMTNSSDLDTDIASDEVDLIMSDFPLPEDERTPVKPSLPTVTPSEIRSDSVDEQFVDAPDHLEKDAALTLAPSNAIESCYGFDDDISPLRDIAEIAVEISPIKSGDYQEYEFATDTDSVSEAGPGAQIIAESVLAGETPPQPTIREPGRGRKRKRSVSGTGPTVSPKMLHSIVLQHTDDATSSTSPRTSLPANQEGPPPNKKNKAPAKTVKTRRTPARAKGKAAVSSDANQCTSRSTDSMSPTPGRTHSLGLPKRTRSSLRAQPIEDVSFIEETQIGGLGSSIENSQPLVTSTGLGPTPIKGRRARSLFPSTTEESAETPPRAARPTRIKDEPQPTPERRKRGRPRLATSAPKPSCHLTTDEIDALQKASDVFGLPDATDSLSLAALQRRVGIKSTELVENWVAERRKEMGDKAVTPATKAREALRRALEFVDEVGMSALEIAEMEDEVFEAFTKLRKRRQDGRLKTA